MYSAALRPDNERTSSRCHSFICTSLRPEPSLLHSYEEFRSAHQRTNMPLRRAPGAHLKFHLMSLPMRPPFWDLSHVNSGSAAAATGGQGCKCEGQEERL